MKPYIPRNLDPYTLDDPYQEDFPRARRPFPLWGYARRFISPFGFACLASAALAIGVGIVVIVWKELEKIL